MIPRSARRATRAALAAGAALLLGLPATVLAQAQVPVGTGTSPDELAPPVKHQARFFARRITGYLPTRDGTQTEPIE